MPTDPAWAITVRHVAAQSERRLPCAKSNSNGHAICLAGPVARSLAFAVGVAAGLSVFAFGVGCTSTGEGAPDGAVGADGQSDVAANCTIRLIQASSYDRSCTVDTDCRAIAEGNSCIPCEFMCTNAAINADAVTKYNADIANTPAFLAQSHGACGGECGPEGNSRCCRGGMCQAGSQCFTPEDAGTDACAPSGCTGSCANLSAHNVSTTVDGCLVWRCCVPDDAGDGPGADVGTQ